MAADPGTRALCTTFPIAFLSSPGLNKVSLGFLLEIHCFSITMAPSQVLSCAGGPEAVGFAEQISHLITYSHGSFSSAPFMHSSSKYKI